GSRWLPPNHFTMPVARCSAATLSSNVRSVVEVSETPVLRTMRQRMRGYFRQAVCSRHRAATDLPVPAGPSRRTSFSRALNSSLAAPRGSSSTTRSEFVIGDADDPGGDGAAHVHLGGRVQAQQLAAGLADLDEPVHRLEDGPIVEHVLVDADAVAVGVQDVLAVVVPLPVDQASHH